MAVVLAVAIYVGTAGGGSQTPAQRASHLLSEVRCPACADLSVTQSNAPSAVAIRQYVDHAVARGESDGAIESYLVSRYGPGVLLNPPASGVTSLVWILPLAVVAAAAAGLALAFRRRAAQAAVKGAGSQGAGSQGANLVGARFEDASFEDDGAPSGQALPGTRVGR
jgi:cytochrome c-type biogenesis protein CcmH